MGCGASSAKIGVDPEQTGSVSQGQQQQKLDSSSKVTTRDKRTSSGKSRDSGFDDHRAQSNTPTPKSVGFRAPVPLTGKVHADEEENEVLQKLRKEGLIQRSLTKTNFGVSFEVVDDSKTVRNRPPPRLAKLERESMQRRAPTDEEIQKKLDKAKRRKRAQEANRISRIQSLTRQATTINPDSLQTNDPYRTRKPEVNDSSIPIDRELERIDSVFQKKSDSIQNERELNSLRRDDYTNSTRLNETNSGSSKAKDWVYWESARNISPTNSSITSPAENQRRRDERLSPLYNRKTSMGSNPSRDLERGKQEDQKRSSYVGHYADDSMDRSPNLNEYSTDAAMDVSAMVASAQEKVDRYNQAQSSPRYGDRLSANTRKASTENHDKLSPGNGSRWLKTGAINKSDDLIGRDDVYDSDSDRAINRDRPVSRLSVPSDGSHDSVDFWNE